MTPRTVGFTLTRPDGEPWANGRIRFDLSTWSWSADEVVIPSCVPGTADEDGAGTVELWANEDEAEQSCSWKATLPGGFVTDEFSVPAGAGTIDLAELLELHSVASTPQYVTTAAAIAAEAAARAAADAAKTSISGTPDFLGQLAVVGGVGYLATGVASSADWKAVTTP